MACMYLGGQRPTQLLRLTPKQLDVSGATVTLLDPKGRNRHANPRRHMLPILDDLMPVIRRRLAQTEDAESPMFSTNGRVPLRKETVALLVTEIAKAMHEGRRARARAVLDARLAPYSGDAHGGAGHLQRPCARRFNLMAWAASRRGTTTGTTTCPRSARHLRGGRGDFATSDSASTASPRRTGAASPAQIGHLLRPAICTFVRTGRSVLHDLHRTQAYLISNESPVAHAMS